MKIEIKSRYDASVLFSIEIGSLKLAVEAAVKARADLRGADLRGADLGGADLRGADLGGADLRGADLGGADLGGADLGGADLRDAYLGGADLGGAGKKVKVIAYRCYGPCGSRSDYTQFWNTTDGIFVNCGCRRGITLDDFEKAVKETYGNNLYGKEYQGLIFLVKTIWSVK